MDINHCIEKTKQNSNILDVWEVKFSLEQTVFLSSFSLLNQKGKKKASPPMKQLEFTVLYEYDIRSDVLFLNL